MSEIVTD